MTCTKTSASAPGKRENLNKTEVPQLSMWKMKDVKCEVLIVKNLL